MRHGLALLAMATALAVPAQAQDAERYRLERSSDGYVRLDTVTGRTALCREYGDQLVCRMAAEERAAYDARLDELEAKLAAMDDRLAALEARWPELRMPDAKDFEQTMGEVERLLRRFMGIAKDLHREFGGEEAEPEPETNRT